MQALLRQALAAEQWDSFSHHIQSSIRLAHAGYQIGRILNIESTSWKQNIWQSIAVASCWTLEINFLNPAGMSQQVGILLLVKVCSKKQNINNNNKTKTTKDTFILPS